MIMAGWHDEVGEVSHVPKSWRKCWDDISGKELKPDLVRAAREEELKVVDEIGVWELRPISECIEVAGKKHVKVRWVDVNKGAKDFNIDERPDLFAATPPLEYLRYLVSRCASSQMGPRKAKLMVQDVTKAYFYIVIGKPGQKS